MYFNFLRDFTLCLIAGALLAIAHNILGIRHAIEDYCAYEKSKNLIERIK